MYRLASRSRIHRAGAVVAAGLALAVIGLAGCGQTVDRPLAPLASATDGWTAEPGAPTVAELTAALDLSAAQQRVIADMLADWRSAAGGTGDSSGPAARGGPGGDSLVGPGGPGDCGPGTDFEPEANYLEQSAAVLSDGQYDTQGHYLSGRRMNHMRRGGGFPGLRGPGASQRVVMRLAHDDALTDTQIAELATAFRTADETIARAAIAYSGLALDVEGLRDAAAGARDTFASSAQNLLPATAYDDLVGLLATRRTTLAQIRLDRLECAIGRRVVFLDATLQLSDEQTQQVSDALNGFDPMWQMMLGGVADGSTSFENAVHESALISEKARAAVRGLLDDAQAERFDAIRQLIPGEVWLVLYL